MYLTLCSLMRKAAVTRSSIRWSKPWSSRLCGLTFPSTTGSQRLPSRSCLHHPFRVSIWHVGIPCNAIVQPTSLTGNRNGNRHWLQTADHRVSVPNNFDDRGSKQADMLRCFRVYCFNFLIFFTRPPMQQHALPPVGKANCCLQGGNGRLFVLTCSSSLHTATSGDCCSPAAYQCGCLPTVWWACTVLVTFLPHGRRSCWARDLPSLTITYPRSGRFGHPRSGGRDVG